MATRLVKQYKKFIIGATLFRGKRKPTRHEYSIVRDIAVGSVQSDLNSITEYLYHKGCSKWTSYKDIMENTELTSENCRRKMENLALLKVVRKNKQGMNIHYQIDEEIHDLIKDGSIY